MRQTLREGNNVRVFKLSDQLRYIRTDVGELPAGSLCVESLEVWFIVIVRMQPAKSAYALAFRELFRNTT